MSDKLKKARVLTRFSFGGKNYKPDDVLELDLETIKHLAENGVIDTHPDAVKYCVEVLQKK